MPAKKQSDGRYRAKVTVAGKAVYVSARTRKELEEKKAAVRDQLITGTTAKAPRTFHALFVEWFTHIYAPTVKAENTLHNKRSAVNKHILPYIDDRALCRAVRRVDLQRVLDLASSSVCNTSVCNILQLLKLFYAYAIEEGQATVNIADSLIINRPEEEDHNERLPISDDDMSKVLSVADETIKPVILWLYYTGLRIGELKGLTWADIDTSTGMIHITKQLNSRTNTISRTKTKSGIRDVPIPDPLSDIIRQTRGLPSARIIPTDIKTLRYHWQKAFYLAGLGTINESSTSIYTRYSTPYTFHCMRHTYVTKLYDAGIDPLTASRIVGHNSYQTTADIYTHISEQRKQQATDHINEVFTKGCRKVAGSNSNDR